MQKKMLIIGAGSAMFTQGLIIDLIKRKPGGHLWTVALCDTDSEVLDDVTLLVQKMIREQQSDLSVIASTDRKALLPGTDYVITTIGVGGRRAWEQDVFIPRKYGIYQPVGDTAMPGGISRAMRMVPAMVEILKDVKALAPTARFFNYANPMAVICRALNKAVDFPAAGLCIGTAESEWHIADYMGYERDRFTTLAAGINHCTFIYDFRYDGQSVKEAIRERVARDYAHWQNADPTAPLSDAGHALSDPFAWQFFMRYGAYPAPGDRHITEFFAEYFDRGRYYGKVLGVDAYAFESTIANGDAIHRATIEAARSDAPLGADFFSRLHGEHEQLTAIMDAIERDLRKVYYVNMPNRGAIPNLPYHAVIEMPAVAAAQGLMPLYTAAFPDALASFTNRFLACVEVTADAALRGDRKLMEEAIMMGGYLHDASVARKLTDELLLAQKMYLR